MDRANRVRLLIRCAFDSVYGWSEQDAEGRAASPTGLRSGKGGVPPRHLQPQMYEAALG